MKSWFLLLAVPVACAGCTSLSLERRTLAQSATASDLRYREILENMAVIANNPAMLPTHSSIFAGTVMVTDTAQLASTTMWQHLKGMPGTNQQGWASELGTPQVTRQAVHNWSLDPVVEPEKLEAMRCCYWWVLFGPEKICGECASLLASPQQDHSPGIHFGVADRLQHLPLGWVRVGKKKDVPVDPCYKACCGDTWVWVMKDGMEGFSQFILVIQDIARVSSSSDSLYADVPSPWQYTRSYPCKQSDDCQLTVKVDVSTDGCNHIVLDSPYRKQRTDNVGSNSFLRSQVNATGASGAPTTPAGQ